MWLDKWVELNLDYCGRIFYMVYKFPGCITDGCAPNDRWTLYTDNIKNNILINKCKIII